MLYEYGLLSVDEFFARLSEEFRQEEEGIERDKWLQETVELIIKLTDDEEIREYHELSSQIRERIVFHQDAAPKTISTGSPQEPATPLRTYNKDATGNRYAQWADRYKALIPAEPQRGDMRKVAQQIAKEHYDTTRKKLTPEYIAREVRRLLRP